MYVDQLVIAPKLTKPNSLTAAGIQSKEKETDKGRNGDPLLAMGCVIYIAYTFSRPS